MVDGRTPNLIIDFSNVFNSMVDGHFFMISLSSAAFFSKLTLVTGEKRY